MSWFIRKKKKKRAGRRKTRPSYEPAWDPQRTFLGLKVLAALALVAAVITGWIYSERFFRGYVTQRSQDVPAASQVVLVDAPSWLGHVLEPLHQNVTRQIGGDPLDAISLQRAAKAMQVSPWVEQVDRVQRMADGRVLVYAHYREPVAMVQGAANSKGGSCYLIDSQGVLLPLAYSRAEAAALKLPVIEGVSTRKPKQAGQPWPGDDIQAALRLVSFLASEPSLEQVDAIDVSKQDAQGRVRLSLRTRDGLLIRWGLAPGDEQAIEQPARIKRQRLAGLCADQGILPAGAQVVDLFGGAIFVHQQRDF